MFDFAARGNSDFKTLVAKNGAVNSAMLLKDVKVSLNDVKGELYSTYWLKYLELYNCIVFSCSKNSRTKILNDYKKKSEMPKP